MGAVVLLLAELRADREALGRHLLAAGNVEIAMADAANLALFALSVHHAYTALEAILERLHRQFVDASPWGGDGHRKLLDDARLELPGVRPRLLSDETIALAHDLRGFRHLVRHAYGLEYDRERLLRVQASSRALATHLAPDLDAIEQWLEAVAPSP